MSAILTWWPRCSECGGPLRELGDEQVHTFPVVFTVEYWCGVCAMVTERLDVGGGWHA